MGVLVRSLAWQPPTGGTKLLAAPVRLRAVPSIGAEREGDAVWNQIAIEGEYKGHPSGDFTLDAQAFTEIIENFRSHPSYEPNPALRAGGCGEVVAWDFHHASEEPASAVGIAGSPAQAWALDLEARKGADGLIELWALVRWLEPAASYVKEGKYRWSSIAVWPDAVDPKTGEKVGWYMSSIALTNDPFIQGMAPLAATRQPTKPATDTVQKKPEHKMPKNLSRIGSTVGIDVPDSADDAQQAVLAERIVGAIKLEKGGREKAEKALAALAQVLGVEDPSGAASRVAELMKASAILQEVMPALAALQEDAAEVPEDEDPMAKEEEADVKAAMRAHNMPEAAKPALMLMRSGGVKVPRLDLTKPHMLSSQLKDLIAARASKRAAKVSFLAQYPIPAAGEEHLLQSFATEPRTPAKLIDAPSTSSSKRIDLSSLPGRNVIEQAMSHVDPEGKMAFNQRHEKAVFLVRELRHSGALTA